MAKLGDSVTYSVSERERAKTVKDNQTSLGSVFHQALTEFAGVVGNVERNGEEVNPVPRCDVAIFVPGSPNIRWVRNVTEGNGPGTFKVIR